MNRKIIRRTSECKIDFGFLCLFQRKCYDRKKSEYKPQLVWLLNSFSWKGEKSEYKPQLVWLLNSFSWKGEKRNKKQYREKIPVRKTSNLVLLIRL